MKLSPDTLQILKNYSAINQSLLFKKGSILSTISTQKNTLAEARVSETFPREFALYDLNEFLGVLSLFTDPVIEATDTHLLVKEENGKSAVKYFYTDASMIVTPPKDKSRMVEAIEAAEIKFVLNENDFTSLMKAGQVLGSKELAVVSDGSTTSITVLDEKNSTSNTYSVELDEANGTPFKMVFKLENLKVLKGSYEVSISSQLLSHFKNTELDLQYFVSLEDTSTYGN